MLELNQTLTHSLGQDLPLLPWEAVLRFVATAQSSQIAARFIKLLLMLGSNKLVKILHHREEKVGGKRKKGKIKINPQQAINATESYKSGTSRLDKKVQLNKLNSKCFHLRFIQ